MLAVSIQRQIITMLSQGQSIRFICRELQVSRSAVYRLSERGLPEYLRGGPGECRRCGGLLPCVKCAKEVRALSGNVGKEPDEPDITLAPEVALATASIRTGWSEMETLRRAGETTKPYTIPVFGGVTLHRRGFEPGH